MQSVNLFTLILVHIYNRTKPLNVVISSTDIFRAARINTSIMNWNRDESSRYRYPLCCLNFIYLRLSIPVYYSQCLARMGETCVMRTLRCIHYPENLVLSPGTVRIIYKCKHENLLLNASALMEMKQMCTDETWMWVVLGKQSDDASRIYRWLVSWLELQTMYKRWLATCRCEAKQIPRTCGN